MADSHLQGSEWAIEHTEDCPADRGDCVCGGYVPLSVAEKLATEMDRVVVACDNGSDPENKLKFIRRIVAQARDEFRAAYPREETTG